MLLLWKVRYIDTCDRQFRDRNLFLDTETLDPVTKAAVELCHELSTPGHAREFLRYRNLFEERHVAAGEINELHRRYGGFSPVSVHDYLEDEKGKARSLDEIGAIVTGRPNVISVPAGAKHHDIEYMLAEKRAIPLQEATVSEEGLRVLGYFSRDLAELCDSSFYREGPGTLTQSGNADFRVETSVTDEEIRSFVTIFRRLYMTGEPAGFLAAASVFVEAVGDHPLGRWVEGAARQYETELAGPPDFVPYVGRDKVTFGRKRLIDVFLYTRYVHQPDGRRTQQFDQCLAAVGGNRALLTWLFLGAIHHCSVHIRNAGVRIAAFFERYCECHDVRPELQSSVASENPGIGTLEKEREKRERLFEEKAEEIARTLWRSADRPAGGPAQFLPEARAKLRVYMEEGR